MKNCKTRFKIPKCKIKNRKSNMVPNIIRLDSANLVHRFAHFLDSDAEHNEYSNTFGYSNNSHRIYSDSNTTMIIFGYSFGDLKLPRIHSDIHSGLFQIFSISNILKITKMERITKLYPYLVMKQNILQN